jgi:hypothetical protein
MKNCPAVSQERVDLRRLLRGVKLRAEPNLLRACLQRMPAIDHPAQGASPNSDCGSEIILSNKGGSSKVQRQATSSRCRMGQLKRNCRRKKASSHCSWSIWRFEFAWKKHSCRYQPRGGARAPSSSPQFVRQVLSLPCALDWGRRKS